MTRTLVAPWAVPWAAPWVTPLRVARAVSRWPVDSQLRARRNALVASTELAARSLERRQVDQYLAGLAGRWADRGTPARHQA